MKPIFPITDKKLIESYIPHRSPIVMVDKLIDFTENYIIGGLRVLEDNIFVEDNVLKEPGLIEHMAQTVALHSGYQFSLKDGKALTGYIGSIKKIQIERLPQIHEEIETEVTIIQEYLGITLVEIVSKCNGNIIATGELKTVIAN